MARANLSANRTAEKLRFALRRPVTSNVRLLNHHLI